MEEFTEEEKLILKPYFTNLSKPIFGLINLPEVVKGALFSRYSRTDESLRKVLLTEFISKPEMGFSEIVGKQSKDSEDQIVATKKAENFYNRVLIGYGDDSVAELGGAHIAVEQVTQIAAKFIESARLGLSPLEKSTRYIWFDKKVNGKYKYYIPKKIENSKFKTKYIEFCDMLFDIYSKLIPEMTRFFKDRFPKDLEISDRGYEAVIRAKACDVLRVFLPASTITNLGLFGNGRAYEYLLTKMFAHPLEEIRDIAESMHEELSKMVPSFVKRANDEKYGTINQGFIRETNTAMNNLAKNYEKQPENAGEVTLVDYSEGAELKVISSLLYQYSKMPLEQIKDIVKNMDEEEKKQLIEEHLKRRKNRRHKPGRAFENIYYRFDILANYGIYRDLQRHRILTQEPQDLTTRHGYDTPKELIEAGFKKEYDEAMKKASEFYEEIYKEFPKEAQYVVPFGYKIRWYITMNLREIFHFTELRSAQQGHPDYRRVAQLIAKQVMKVHPLLTKYLKFVDFKDYDLERIEAEKKLDKKIDSINA